MSQPYSDPSQGRPAYPQQPPQYQGQGQGQGQGQMQPATHDQRRYPPAAPQPGYPGLALQAAGKRYALRGAESFWYVLGCIAFGAAYFAKLPAKKAASEIFSELQLDGQGPSQGYTLRGAETFWYILQCLAFGGGYFAKVWAKKALWEVVGMMQSARGDYREALFRALGGAAAPGRAVY